MLLSLINEMCFWNESADNMRNILPTINRESITKWFQNWEKPWNTCRFLLQRLFLKLDRNKNADEVTHWNAKMLATVFWFYILFIISCTDCTKMDLNQVIFALLTPSSYTLLILLIPFMEKYCSATWYHLLTHVMPAAPGYSFSV